MSVTPCGDDTAAECRGYKIVGETIAYKSSRFKKEFYGKHLGKIQVSVSGFHTFDVTQASIRYDFILFQQAGDLL
jgi:hypothetical protein